MRWSDLTTPPSPRPLESRHPLFTRKFFSTKSFGPGHVVGAGILALGIFGLWKYGRAEAVKRARGLPPPPSKNRGQYDTVSSFGRKSP